MNITEFAHLQGFAPFTSFQNLIHEMKVNIINSVMLSELSELEYAERRGEYRALCNLSNNITNFLDSEE